MLWFADAYTLNWILKMAFFQKEVWLLIIYTPCVVLSLCNLFVKVCKQSMQANICNVPRQYLQSKDQVSMLSVDIYRHTLDLAKTTQRYEKKSNCLQNLQHSHWSSSPLWLSSPSEHHYWLALGRLEIFAQVWKFGRPSPLVWRPVSLFNFNWNLKEFIPYQMFNANECLPRFLS